MNIEALSLFGIYRMFHAVKLHFTTSTYDFFKYYGRIKLTEKSYEESNEKYSCEKLRKKYTSDKDLLDLFVSNIYLNSTCWIGDLSSEDSYDILMKYKSKRQALTHVFKEDMLKLFEEKKKRTMNEIFQFVLSQEIEPESFLILSKILPIFKTLDGKNDILWNHFKGPLIKYNRFLILPEDNIDKYKKILQDVLNNE